MGTDRVELELPFKAEYVSVARLAASGICSRIGFDIETIEDIKVAISEVCNKIVSTGSKSEESYRITYILSAKKLEITFYSKDTSLKCLFDEKVDEFGISIISALMDSVEFCSSNEYILSMSKELEGNL